MLFELSENESQILGYRIARGGLDSLQHINQLKESLIENRIDILKLSVTDSPEDLYVLLDKLKIPYYVLGIVIEYKANFQKNKQIAYRNQSVEFVEYTGDDTMGFDQLITKIFAESPASYYLNPGLLPIYDKEKQLQCLTKYVKTLNKSKNGNYFTHLVYCKGELAGFITSYKEGTGGAATYAGLLKEFQGRGLYIDLVSFIQNHGSSIGQKWGTAYAQLQNTVVQKTFQRQGLRPNGYVLNIHVNCFFGELSKYSNH